MVNYASDLLRLAKHGNQNLDLEMGIEAEVFTGKRTGDWEVFG